MQDNLFTDEQVSAEQRLNSLASEIFSKEMKSQFKTTSKLLLLIFGSIGAVFILVGIIMLAVQQQTVGFVFFPLGLFLMFFGVVLSIVFSKVTALQNYENYKSKMSRFGYANKFEIQAKLILQQEQLDELTEEVKQLKENARFYR